MKKIIFYAPLGKNIPIEKIGGAEAGCLKTKAIYEKNNIEVITIDKPTTSRGRFLFFTEMFFLPFLFLLKVLRYGRNTPVHIVGFYTKNAKVEQLLMKIAHFCGNKVIYEIRNGSMIYTYENGNDNYCRTLKSLLLEPEVVLCQGQDYVDFIKNQWGVDRTFYPNYIMDDFLSENNTDRPKPIKLIYFGRVTESKNVDVSIEVLSLLRNDGLDATLDIIGGYNDEYKSILDKKVIETQTQGYVTFYGRKPFDFIVNKLKDAHYFVFPSSEFQEGHSNSLTEAMGCGVVPIVSNAGFNRTICGDNYLVIDSLDSNLFKCKIVEIESKRFWAIYSERVYNRVKQNFTEEVVSQNLIDSVLPLFQE